MRRGKAIAAAAILLICAALLLYPIDMYISKPGGAYELSPFVAVEDGDENDEGTFSLMTIAVSKARPLSYVYAKFSDKQKLLPAYKVRRHGESDHDYNVRQKKLMSNSQFNAIRVAYEKTKRPIQIKYDSVFVMMVLKGGAADGKLNAGDRIYEVDGVKLERESQFANLISTKEIGDSVSVSFERDGEKYSEDIIIKEIPGPESSGKAGMGIQFEEDRQLITDPKVEFDTSDIGGPSAGLMFALEIMNQILEEDLTKGYNIAGTGEMLEDGTVGRIGGAAFKVIAADRKGIEIFFAPDDDVPEEVRKANPGITSNYEEAIKMGKKIGTKMKIVPVKTVDDALEYLDQLPDKTAAK